MIHKCAVGGCPNKSDTIIHYILPEDPRRRSQWLQFIERSTDGENVPVSSRICGDHFSESSFTKLDLGFTTRLILNVDAVPTIYPEHFSKLQEQNSNTTAENGTEMEEESGTTIIEAISLACVKDEPLEFELGVNVNLQEELNTGSVHGVKHEEDERSLADEGNTQGYDRLQLLQAKILKNEDNSGCSDMSNPESDTDEQIITSDKPFRCSYCGEGFRNRGVLMQHESCHADGSGSKGRIYQCNHCQKRFTLKAFLKAHQKIHENLESTALFSCSQCHRRFQNKGSLKSHMRNHSVDATFPCPVCEDEFQIKGALSQHIKTVHPGCKLPCKLCDKKFQKTDAYCKHLDRHNVVTPYYCESCNVYQLTERGYVCHQRIHARRRLLQMRSLGLNATAGNNVAHKADGEISQAGMQDSEVLNTQNDIEERVGLGLGSVQLLQKCQQKESGITPAGDLGEGRQTDSETGPQREPVASLEDVTQKET